MDAEYPSSGTMRRRAFLALAGTVTTWASLPRLARATTTDDRLIVIVLRGALDGLYAVPPVGDPAYGAIRADLAPSNGQPPLKLDGFFGLHPSLPKLHGMFHAKELVILHAVATPYRERSHFDGQDVLESGVANPRQSSTGWLNRAVAGLPVEDAIRKYPALATTATVPLILRGKAPVLTWTPSDFAPSSTDTVARLLSLYEQLDPKLAEAFAAGQQVNMLAEQNHASEKPKEKPASSAFQVLATGAGRLMAQQDGPRVAVISYDGWDTHAREILRLDAQLGALDDAIDSIKSALGPVWKRTKVLVVTEFGRTVRKNGTGGTDHGTGTVAFVAGGGFNGGRIVADWPGLSSLHEGRDLKPTADMRGIMKAVLSTQFDIPEGALATSVFPESGKVKRLLAAVE